MTSEGEADVCIHQNTQNKSAVSYAIDRTANEATPQSSNLEEVKNSIPSWDHPFCISTQMFPKNPQVISYFLIHITHYTLHITHYTLHITHLSHTRFLVLLL